MKILHKALHEYHVSKDFFPLHFAVSQVLSVSGYDLKTENGGENADFDFVPRLFTLLT